jgi:ferredoxin-NADP reductase/anaerobic selenocysteine-containing dehydrogenase
MSTAQLEADAPSPTLESTVPGSGVGARVPTIEHAGLLPDLLETPRYLMPRHESGVPQIGRVSCSFCGVGDGGRSERVPEPAAAPEWAFAAAAMEAGSVGRVWVTDADSTTQVCAAKLLGPGRLELSSSVALVAPGAVLRGVFEVDGARVPFVGREVERRRAADGAVLAHVLEPFSGKLSAYREVLQQVEPTTGCIKLRHSMMRQRTAYPIQSGPSVLDPATGRRRPISYAAAISKLAELLLAHRAPSGRTLLYASGQIDYFAIFALQEVLRLLGVRNLTGNAEHCLNAGAVHNEMLTGQEGPFVTIQQALEGPSRFYLLNGWNGFITHPPVFRALLARKDLDCYLIEVMVTESAKAVAESLGKERVLLIRPRTDPHLALAVAHELFLHHPQAVHREFVARFADGASFEAYRELASSERFAPERVAERIAAEPQYEERLLLGIRRIALKLAQAGSVPINIASMGLSQTSGAVAHCLWGSALGLVGKYGLNAIGSLAGGTLRLAGQINAESEVQGLSRRYFMGRVPMSAAADAARRMGLPDDAYDAVVADPGRAALDYSEPTPGTRELFVCMGTQFEANMMGRKRWIDKLTHPETTLVVIDPIVDSWTEAHAALILPSPPHPATTKLYQNGEWKLTLSVPQKLAAPETRSDATIIYDTMAEITRRIELDRELASQHPDLARHARSGYLAARFCARDAGGALTRLDGEVSRPELWQRILDYMSGGAAHLYCRPEHADGRAIEWTELLERGSVYYGGIGENRFLLEYDNPEAQPFRDVYRRPSRFKFFVPTSVDLEIPTGTLFSSGRSPLSDERSRIAFAVGTFNSGKATPIVGMPDENPLFVSPAFARKHGIESGQRVRLRHPDTGGTVELPAVVSDRMKGDLVYASFHKSRAQMDGTQYINDVTSHEGRCAYTSQTNMKATRVLVERVELPAARDLVPVSSAAPAPPASTQPAQLPVGRAAFAAVARALVKEARGEVLRGTLARAGRGGARINTTLIDPKIDLPIWSGRDTPLYVTEIIRDTHNVYTFRLQGDPLCRFVYWPGQFCTLVLPIDGKKVVRSYSISSSPTRPFVLEFTVKRVAGGLVSNWLPDHLKVGDRLEISGPKGKFCLVPGQIPDKLLLLSAGSGITPLMSMTRWLCDISASVDLKFLNSVQTPEDLVFRRELELLAGRHDTFESVVSTTSRTASSSWAGLTGRIDRIMLERVAPDLAERHVYLCGPEGFMLTARGLLSELGFDAARLHSESFAPPRSQSADVSDPAADLGTGAAGASPGLGLAVQLEFARTGKRVSGNKRLPLLDIAEANGIELEYGCRTGSCGDCKVRLLRGEVDPGSHSALSETERNAGWVLSCVATARTDCVLDA